jgi:hypothetical protein
VCSNCRKARCQQAVELHQRTLTVYRRIGDRYGEATALARLGMVALRQDHHEQAPTISIRH